MREIIHDLLMNQVSEQIMLVVAGAVLQEWIGERLFKRQPYKQADQKDNESVHAEEASTTDASSPARDAWDRV